MNSTTRCTGPRSSKRGCWYSLRTRERLKSTTQEIILSQVRTACLCIHWFKQQEKYAETGFVSFCSGAKPVFGHDICWIQEVFPCVEATGDVTQTGLMFKRVSACFVFCCLGLVISYAALCRTALLPKGITAAAMGHIPTPSTGEIKEILWHQWRIRWGSPTQARSSSHIRFLQLALWADGTLQITLTLYSKSRTVVSIQVINLPFSLIYEEFI